MQLSEEDIKNLLAKYGVFMAGETEGALVFPTACHNLTGGSPKLYYYKQDKIFRCYTGCNEMFDIFDLIIRMKKLRGEEITLRESIKLTGVEEDNSVSSDVMEDLEYIRRLKESKSFLNDEVSEVRILDKKIIDRFSFNIVGLKPWLDEGISKETLLKYRIKYDSTINAIIIPNFDHDGELIGIRGRFFGENAVAKYMPIKYNGNFLSHPTGKFFYGYNLNKDTIRRIRKAVIFEGEKSVMKMETLYPGNNISLATAGKKITLDQLSALIKLDLDEVILAYDADYKTAEERKKLIAEYDKIVQLLKPYFNVSIMVDYNWKLGYKDSPIDKGKEVFDELFRDRIKR